MSRFGCAHQAHVFQVSCFRYDDFRLQVFGTSFGSSFQTLNPILVVVSSRRH